MREPLTPERIVDAAVALFDEVGIDRFSMRRLGAALGVDPMAVYRHVPDRDAVVAGAVDRVIGAMVEPDPTSPWDVQIEAWLTGFRAAALRHPEVVRAATSGAAGTTPAMAAAWGWLERAVLAAGVPRRDAGAVTDALVDQAVGAVLGEAAARTMVTGSASAGTVDVRRLDAAHRASVELAVGGVAAVSAAGGVRAARSRRARR